MLEDPTANSRRTLSGTNIIVYKRQDKKRVFLLKENILK